MTIEKRFWDTTVLLAYLNDEQGRAPICSAILKMAERGEIKIIISALAIAEVLHYKGLKPIKAENRKKVIEFFQNSYITVVDVDRFIARDAQELFWENNIKPKDAIHVATALKIKADVMEAYDDDLLKRSKKVGSPSLLIREPTEAQLLLPYESKKKASDEEELVERE